MSAMTNEVIDQRALKETQEEKEENLFEVGAISETQSGFLALVRITAAATEQASGP